MVDLAVQMYIDKRHTIIGGRHRALSRYYMILNRLKKTNLQKNKCYKNITLNLDKEDFINWFMENDFKGCSVDRINNKEGYYLENLQLISLSDNIAKDKIKEKDGLVECFRCKKTLSLNEMAKDKRRKNGHSTICKKCDNRRKL